MKKILRRNFLKISGLTLFGMVSNLILAACAKSSNDPVPVSTAANCSANGAKTNVGSNHGHTSTTIAAGDIVTATQQTYVVGAGAAGHSHSVTVAAGNFTTLQGNTSVFITTDPDATGHSHVITVNCS